MRQKNVLRSIGGSNLIDARRSSSVESARIMGEAADIKEIFASDVVNSSDDDDDSDVDKAPKNQRDDLVNPFWIDDRDLKSGPIDFLPGSEQQFWKDLIEKYLEPEPIKTKEVEKKQAKTAEDLKTLRNQMVSWLFYTTNGSNS